VSYRNPKTALLGLITLLEHRENTKTKSVNGSAARSPLGCCCLIRGAVSKEIHTLLGGTCLLQRSVYSVACSSYSLPYSLALLFRYFLMHLAIPENLFHSSNGKIRGFLKYQAYFQLEVED